MVKINASK